MRAASNTSRGRLSKNLWTSSTLNALAPAGSHTAQKLLMSERPSSGGSRIVRYSGTSRTIAGTNIVDSTSACTTFPYRGRSTDSA
ncbi:Uncharacterised protein [Mycobacteroides abscessus]|nr:Uncharacterised protein [Mycobacteroides abscessus]